MMEKEWFALTDPRPMLRFLIGIDDARVQDIDAFPDSRGSGRKLRLFACACVYRIRHILPPTIAFDAVEVAERFADHLTSARDLGQAEAEIRDLSGAIEERWRASRGAERTALHPTHAALALAGVVCWKEPQKAAYYAASTAHFSFAGIMNPGASGNHPSFGESQLTEERAQCELLREIFGNPFRPVAVDPAWRTSDVLALGCGIYEERAFDRMPILADALQDAGCDSDDILNHLRDATATHVRGCWALDLVLGKE